MDQLIPWPRRGIDENWSFSDQPALTAYDAQNVRTKDPKTGRLRGGQRAGHSKYTSTQIQASFKIKRLFSVVYDQPNITFANKSTGLSSSDTEETQDTPSGGVSYHGITDRLGNIYALDGSAGIVKYNPQFNEVWRLNLPTDDSDHVVRALHVDEFFCLYAAVSSGGDPSTARMWKYAPDFDNNTRLVWQHEPGGYVWKIIERNGVVYAIVDRPDVQKSALIGFTGFDRINPTQILGSTIPYPANDLGIGPDGSLFTCHESFANRGRNPQAPDADPVLVSWTPRELTDWQERIWSWHDGFNIDGKNNATLSEDDDVLVWYDQSGHGRHYYAAVDETLGTYMDTTIQDSVTVTPPTFSMHAQAGNPGVRFNGVSNLMKSEPNVSDSFAMRDAQKTGVPAYRPKLDSSGAEVLNTSSAFVMFLAVRVDPEEAGAVSRFLWSHEDADRGDHVSHWSLSAGDRHILVNKTSQDLTDNVTSTDRGRVMVFEQTLGQASAGAANGGNGPDGQPASGNLDTDAGASDFGFDDEGNPPTFGNAIDNTSGVVILTYLCDGNFQDGTFDASTTHSLLRINGRPIDRWQSLYNYSIKPDYLGGTGIADADMPDPSTGNVFRFFKGNVLERIVLDRGAIGGTPTTEDILIAHQKFGYGPSASGSTAWPGTGTNQADNEMTKIEGYLAGRWGKRDVLPVDANEATSTKYGHPFENDIPLTTGADTSINSLDDATALLCKWSGDTGLPIWVVSSNEGVGLALALNSDGEIYSYGPTATSTNYIRMVIDNGEDPTFSGGSTWQDNMGLSDAAQAFDDNHPRLTVDSLDNLYVPVNIDPSSGTNPDGDLIVYDKDGTQLNDWDRTAAGQWLAYGVAVPPTLPPYPSSLSSQRSDFVYVFGKGADQAANDIDNIAKVAIVTKTVNTSSPRVRRNIAVSNDDIIRFDSSGIATPTNGSNALDASARWVDGVAAREAIFLTDGSQYKYYDAPEDEVKAWEATSAGEIPPRCRLIAQWNGRIVLARGDDPFNWFMSAKNAPFDWDFAPPVPVVTQAIRGSDSRLGVSPDVITALIPYNDNVLFIGCDSSIHRIIGEPLDNDQFDLVTDKVGIAWNSSWTKDREGRIYFFESQGGIWVMSGDGSQRQRLTRDTIERRLQSIDLEDHYVHLEWSFELEGLHVYVFPYGSGGTLLNHYFWEQQVDAWWEDNWTATDKQPTAALTIDGDDPSDRVLLVGTEDGYVLKEDKDADDDDGQAIDSQVLIGPLPPADPRYETRYTRLRVELADNQNGCMAKTFRSNEPDVLGHPVYQRALLPGHNAPIRKPVAASKVWVELRDARNDSRWAFERMMVKAYRGRRLAPRARENTVGA